MATTKPKESTLVKEKKGISPSTSLNSAVKKVIKQSKPSPSAKDTSTTAASKKPVPNYLKPTLSSLHDPLKQVKKHGPEDSSHKINPIRRRSFDKPPSASRVQNPHISPGPRQRATVKASTSTVKLSPIPKPNLGKTTKTSSKVTKVQPVPAKVVKSTNVAPKKASTAWVPKENSPSPENTPSPTSSETKKEEKEVVVHEVEKEEEVPKSDGEDHSDVSNSDINEEEHEEVKPAEAADVSENDDVHPEETEVEENKEKTSDQAAEEEDHNKDENGIHQEEDSAVEAEVKAAEDKAEEEVDNKEEVELSKETDNEIDTENKPASNVEEDKEQVESKEEEQESGSAAEEQKPVSANVESSPPSGQGKKDSPPYNDVIEETSKKLMEKKQNKVLALAGAFQRVIDHESSSK